MTVIDSSASTTPEGSDAAADSPSNGSDDKAGSLLPVIRVIPKSAYENPTWKGLAFFARDLVFYGLVLLVIIIVQPAGVWPWLARLLGLEKPRS